MYTIFSKLISAKIIGERYLKLDTLLRSCFSVLDAIIGNIEKILAQFWWVRELMKEEYSR